MGPLTFTSLPALLLASVIPLAVLAYRLRKPGKRTVVSSLLLFENLTPRSHRRRRIEVPIRFLFEALAMLLIVVAIGGIALREPRNHVVLLIDNSLSMTATTGGGRTRMELARERVSQFIDQQPGHTTFDVYRISPTPEKLSPEPVQRQQVQTLVDQIEASAAAGLLGGAVEQIRKQAPSDRIVVVTDHIFEPVLTTEGMSEGLPNGITLLSSFEASANAFLTSIREEQPGLSQRKQDLRTVVATAELSGALEGKFRAELKLAGTGTASAPLMTKVVRLREIQPTEIRFDIPLKAQEQTALQVELTPVETSNGASSGDSIELDNRAFIVLGATPENELLFVSDRFTKGSGLERLPFVTLRAVSTADYLALEQSEFDQFRAIIFHRFVPNRLPKKPSLFVVPPPGNALFPIERTVSEKNLSSWDENHPLLLYLQLAAFRVPLATVFDTPPWAQSIARVEEGTVLLAGESGGVRLIGSGIELIPYEQARTPGPSILLLNALKWMLGGASFRDSSSFVQLRVGEQILSPDGTPLSGETGDGGFVSVELRTPGIYRRIASDTSSSRSTSLAHNLFLPEESRTGTSSGIAFSPAIESNQVENERLRPLWKLCLGLASLLLLIDLLIALSNRSDPSQRRSLRSLLDRSGTAHGAVKATAERGAV